MDHAAWGGLCKFKLCRTGKVSALFGVHVIAYNLIRLGNLLKKWRSRRHEQRSPELWPEGSDQGDPTGQIARMQAL